MFEGSVSTEMPDNSSSGAAAFPRAPASSRMSFGVLHGLPAQKSYHWRYLAKRAATPSLFAYTGYLEAISMSGSSSPRPHDKMKISAVPFKEVASLPASTRDFLNQLDILRHHGTERILL